MISMLPGCLTAGRGWTTGMGCPKESEDGTVEEGAEDCRAELEVQLGVGLAGTIWFSGIGCPKEMLVG